MIGQGVIDHRREVSRNYHKQRAEDLAKQKAQAAQAKLASDEKALAEACDGLWRESGHSFNEIEESCIKPLAEAGNTAAQRQVGGTLETSREYSGAIAWYERAANQSDHQAMYSLALLYAVGDTHKFVEKRYDPLVDPRKAVYWYTRAADLGNVDAMRELGDIHREGDLKPQDYLEARKWYLRAAEAGDRISLGSLASMAKNGQGAAPDLIEAYKWFSLYCASFGGRPFQLGCSERDDVAERLNSADILKAQALASQWTKQFGK